MHCMLGNYWLNVFFYAIFLLSEPYVEITPKVVVVNPEVESIIEVVCITSHPDIWLHGEEEIQDGDMFQLSPEEIHNTLKFWMRIYMTLTCSIVNPEDEKIATATASVY